MTLSEKHLQMIRKANFIWMLLDYDGTLADFSPTPDDVFPDATLIALLKDLADHPRFSLAIISGRRLSHIEKLLPIESVWLAGSYGLEMRLPTGEYLQREDYDVFRPKLNQLKPAWEKLIDGKEGFYLEDKGWSIALHARLAENTLATKILEKARSLAKPIMTEKIFNLLGGYKFLEIAPVKADKGQTVEFLLNEFGNSNILPIYLGDDDKDEKAFPVVQAHGGLSGCVSFPPRRTNADFTIASPQEARKWLQILLSLN